MLKRVPTVRTNFSSPDFVKCLVEVWREQYKQIPQKKQIAVMWAQWALETGQGGSCWNFNIGNVKAKDNPNETIEYCALVGVWEIVNGKKIILTQEDPGSWFRSFPTLKDGVNFHLNFLRNKRYKIAWSAVEAGDPALFSKLLRQQGYYTASEEHYTKAVVAYYNKFFQNKWFEQAVEELTATTVAPAPEPKLEPVDLVLPKVNVDYEPKFKEDSEPLELTPWQKVQQAFFSLFKK